MGARLIVRQGPNAVLRRRESRTLAIVIASVAGPCLLMFFLIGADMRSDLSDLRPRSATFGDGARLIGWSQLGALLPEGRVRMLGYMMDGYKSVPDGTPITTFMLMPEAGHLLHPAHRDPDERVEVRLADGSPVPYSDRAMTWAEGYLKRSEKGAGAAYALEQATVSRADERAISQWFGFR